MTQRRIGVMAALVLALVTGCGSRNDKPAGPPNEAVIAALGTVRALHHQADVYEHAGDFQRARQAVERVLSVEFPQGAGERDDLRADAYGRLGELDLRLGQPEAGLDHIAAALAETQRESVLRARLFMVKGQCLSAQADRARERHDEAAANRFRDEALAALETSIEINTRVLRRVLGDGGRRR